MSPLPPILREPGTITAPPGTRAPYRSPAAQRLARRTRDLINRIRALEMDYHPDETVSIPMRELSYLASAIACSDAMLDECRKSRLQILQGFANCREN